MSRWIMRKLRTYGIRRNRWTRNNLVRFLETQVALNPHHQHYATEVMDIARLIENGASIKEALEREASDDFVRRMIYFFQHGAWTTQKEYQAWG